MNLEVTLTEADREDLAERIAAKLGRNLEQDHTLTWLTLEQAAQRLGIEDINRAYALAHNYSSGPNACFFKVGREWRTTPALLERLTEIALKAGRLETSELSEQDRQRLAISGKSR